MMTKTMDNTTVTLISQEEKNLIDVLCVEYGINNYTINLDGSIDVDGNVCLTYMGLIKIPLNFNKVSGNFACVNNLLTSLKGCPKEVGGNFDCQYNELRTLSLSPSVIGGNFNCSNNRLKLLKHSPSKVGGSFDCHNNRLTSLEGSPSVVVGDFNCSDNYLTSLKGGPNEVGQTFNCKNNKLISLEFSPTVVGDFLCYVNNNLPSVINDTFIGYGILSKEQRGVFLKYQSYYDVWTPELNMDGMRGLISDIKDGLL